VGEHPKVRVRGPCLPVADHVEAAFGRWFTLGTCAEAVLKLRALLGNVDFGTYWSGYCVDG
jgi:hypothetical protein